MNLSSVSPKFGMVGYDASKKTWVIDSSDPNGYSIFRHPVTEEDTRVCKAGDVTAAAVELIEDNPKAGTVSKLFIQFRQLIEGQLDLTGKDIKTIEYEDGSGNTFQFTDDGNEGTISWLS